MKGPTIFGLKREELIGKAEKNFTIYPLMIFYNDKLALSHTEIDNHTSLTLHTIYPCMFSCYKCFNQPLLETQQAKKCLMDLRESLVKMESLTDVFILSGGEYLCHSLHDLTEDLTLLRQITSKPIILYTTGLHQDKLRYLYEHDLIDGIHMDVKLPYPYLSLDTDEALIQLTLGTHLSKHSLDALIRSMHYVVKHDKGFNQLRSVRYPFIHSQAFDIIASYVQTLNKHYQKTVPYRINPFYDI